MMHVLKLWLCGVVVAVSASAALAQDRPQIVTVNAALHDFVQRLVADAADVTFPVPDGVDPSFWRPTIADISAVQSADLIVLNGAGFATWTDRVSLPRSRVVKTTAGLKDRFIVTERITHSHGDAGEHAHEGLASYTWLDPMLAIKQAEAIAGALISRKLVPEQDVETRLVELRSELTALDTEAQRALSALQGTPMIATHPRFQYFAARYGLSIVSLEWDAGAMPTKAQLADLARLKDDQGARLLIWEAEPPQEAIEAAADLGLQSVIFEPGATKPRGGTFLQSFLNAVTALARTVQ